jgi:hypothetical protein
MACAQRGSNSFAMTDRGPSRLRPTNGSEVVVWQEGRACAVGIELISSWFNSIKVGVLAT